MENINTQSIMKAAGIGAGINIIIGILGGAVGFLNIEAVGALFGLFACCGGILIPVITGALYGYFTPGQETLGQAALGGAISGLAAGIVYGIVSGIINAISGLVNGLDFSAVISTSGTTILLSCCGAIIFGSILGAVGGAVWTAVQGGKGADLAAS